MIRATMALWLVLALAASGGLYYVKYSVQRLEQELRAIEAAILREREAIHVLEAEWSYLNRPDALAELSRNHLRLAPLAGAGTTTVDALPSRLPAQAGAEVRAASEAAARVLAERWE